MRDTAKAGTVTSGGERTEGGERGTGTAGAGTAGTSAGDAMRASLRGKSFEAGAEVLRPRRPTRITVDLPAAFAWGGYLRPSFSASVGLTPDEDWQGEPTSVETTLAQDVPRAMHRPVSESGASLVPSASTWLPGAAQITDAVERGAMSLDRKRGKGWRLAISAVETTGWQLAANSGTEWNNLDVNPTQLPNMDIDIGGGRVALEVSAHAKIWPRAWVGRFDWEARAGVVSWLEVALRSTLYPMLAAGQGTDSHDMAQVTEGLVARAGGLLAQYHLGLPNICYAVTQRGKPFVPPEKKVSMAQAYLGGSKGSASFIASADRKEYAHERKYPKGSEEVEQPSPEVMGRIEERDWHGDFTYALMAMLKKHPELSITDAAERLIKEQDLPKQAPEVFAIDDDAPAEVGKGTGDDSRKKRALVVGCGAYRRYKPLPGAANDARAMAAVLTARGFEVDHREDLSAAAFADAIFEFGTVVVGPDEHCVIYFAGHGTGPGHKDGEGVVGSDDAVLPHALLVRWVAHLKALDADVELVLDVCHAGIATDLGEDSYLGGAHNKDMTGLERQLFEIHRICKQDYEYVFDYLVGARKTDWSRASGTLANGQETFNNGEIVGIVEPRFEACAAQFLEATGKPLVAPERLGGGRNTRGLFAALQQAHGISQAAWYEAVNAKRTQ